MFYLTTIGFVRHGVTAWNKEGRAQGSSDIPLDDEGIAMAEYVAKRLAEEQWDVVYTSPLIRAKKTAEIILERKPGVSLLEDNRLREFGGGLIEGTTEVERLEKWGESWRDLELGVEPNDEIISRGMAFIEDMKTAHPGQRVLVVSHGGFIKRLVGALVPDEELENKLDNTSVTVVELQEHENLCSLFNCTKHLEREN
ncbi:histidine phosphatase family protein [Sporosarcina sp. NPDC096371]|uniref:histidine phosphatase family protein n=1 Tax=Sporosarcina sp. NPDC096371 TaxID=3364530 RepID=UPI003813AF9A